MPHDQQEDPDDRRGIECDQRQPKEIGEQRGPSEALSEVSAPKATTPRSRCRGSR